MSQEDTYRTITALSEGIYTEKRSKFIAIALPVRTLEEVKQHLGDQVSIIKIDVDQNQSVAAQYQVRSVPTLVIFKNGQIRWRQAGVFPANELERLLKENI